MGNLLGIDFFRIVGENVQNEWSQVYAKIPFEKEELDKRGSSFAVIRLIDGEDCIGRGSELITKIEEGFGGSGEGGIKKIFDTLCSSEEKVEVLLVEMRSEETGGRVIRMIASEGTFLEIVRNGARTRLTSEKTYGQVVRGRLLVGDRLLFGVGGLERIVEGSDFRLLGENMEEWVESLSFEVMSDKWHNSMAGLFIRVNERENVTELEPLEAVVLKKKVTKEVAREVPKMKMGEFVTRWKNKLIRPRERVQLKLDGGKKKKGVTLILGVIFLVILVASVGRGVQKAAFEKVNQQYMAVVEPIEKRREDALEMAERNPIGARDLMIGVRNEVEKHRNDFLKTGKEAEWESEVKKVEESWLSVSGERQVNPELFMDISLIRSGFDGESVSYDSGRLVVLDRVKGVVLGITYPERKSDVLMGKGGGQEWLGASEVLKEPVVIAKAGLVVRDQMNYRYPATVGDIVDGGVYGKAVYLFDKTHGEVWKVPVTRNGKETGFGEVARWLKGEAITELTKATDMAIDGDIWVGLADGRVYKFRRGNRENFTMILGIREVKIDKISVNAEEEQAGRVAMLDKMAKKLIVVDKTGSYKGVWNWEGLARVTDMVFVGQNELLLLDGGKLWKLGI